MSDVNSTNTSGAGPVAILAVIAAWAGSVALSDVQVVVSIIGGLAVLVYTVVNTYVLWRDKVRQTRREIDDRRAKPTAPDSPP